MSHDQNKPQTYFRSSLGNRQEIVPLVAEDYHSEIVDWLKTNDYRLDLKNLSFLLAKEFGFCYGVDKAVDMAYEARARFPQKRIFLTYEIIHNPRVNHRLQEMGFHFLSGSLQGGLTVQDITPDDVVVLPAFGVAATQLRDLQKIGCILVDTTCGSVVRVWKRVEKYAKDGFTSLVHGNAVHAETRATVSHAQQFNGQTIVVRTEKQARLVCNIIEEKEDPKEVYTLGSEALSPGFDPSVHLEKIGVANQTTMLARESLKIADMIGESLAKQYPNDPQKEHFRSFDTICSATQDRQDAIENLVTDGKLDLMLVIGGYNSSNTSHLLELAKAKVPAYHICDAGEILSLDEIRHQPFGSKETVITKGWLKENKQTIGLTAGASTPNRAIGETIRRIAFLRDDVMTLETGKD